MEGARKEYLIGKIFHLNHLKLDILLNLLRDLIKD